MHTPESKINKSQKSKIVKNIGEFSYRLNIRYDDQCGNGHNTFAMTMDILKGGKLESYGCQHDEVKKIFPEYSKYIKWHLVSSDGPMHYIANSMYHAKNNDLELARSSAVWPDAQLADFTQKKLVYRLEELLCDFQAAMTELKFDY